MVKNIDKNNLQDSLKRLNEIKEWFDSQEELDLEEGLKRVQEAGELIKISKEKLKGIENKFEEIKKEVDLEGSSEEATAKDA